MLVNHFFFVINVNDIKFLLLLFNICQFNVALLIFSSYRDFERHSTYVLCFCNFLVLEQILISAFSCFSFVFNEVSKVLYLIKVIKFFALKAWT